MPAPANIPGYTPGAELSGTARATVHLAEADGAAAQSAIRNPKSAIPAPFALKTYYSDSPPGPRRAALLHAFRSATEAQIAAHAKAPSRWAAVRATGEIQNPKSKTQTSSAPRAAYLVTDYYPRTLARVVDARLQLDLRAIYALTEGIIEALAALDDAASRPHGALTPGNIFIAGNGPLRKSRIILTEPAPLAGITHAAARAADHRALGTLLATLVRRRTHTGWPIEDGPEWTHLGKHKRPWLDFCNHLLTPTPPPETTTIAELRRRFSLLGGRGMRTRTKIAIPLAAALALSSPFATLRLLPFDKIPASLQEFAITLGNLPPDVEEVPPEFAQLCDIWYEWFGALCAETDAPQNAPLWIADPWLLENILPHTTPAARATLDPRLLTEDNRNLENLSANPPPSAKRGLVVRRTKQAHATLTKLAETFVHWPGIQTLPQTAARLEQLGLATAAAELRTPDLEVLPSINSGRLPPDITRRLRLLSQSTLAERAWAANSQKLDTLAATNDPVLAALRPREIARLAPAPLADLPVKIAETAPSLDTRVNFIRTDWPQKIGRQRWLAESFVATYDPTTPATDDTLARWDSDILDYYIVTPAEDPRQTPALDTAITTAATALRNLTNEETNLATGHDVSAPLAREQTALAADLDTLRSEQVLRKDIPSTREKTTALQNRYATLAQKIAAALDELHPDPAEWLARIRAATATASPALNAEWTRRRDALLQDITPQRLASNDTAFRDLRTRLRQTREYLAELDGPQLANSIKPLELPAGIPEPIAAQTLAADTTQKETLLADLLRQTQWTPGNTPATTPDALAQASRARIDQLATWRQSAATLAQNLARLDLLLTLGAAWDEPLPLSPGNAEPRLGPYSISALKPIITTSPAYPAITAAGRPAQLAAALARLETLLASTDRPALLAAATDTAAPLSIPLAAWTRLDALPDWPATLAELDREATLQTTLRTRIQNTDTYAALDLADTQKTKLETLAAAAPQRWRRAYAQIAPDLTPDIIARMPQFNITPDALTGLDRFDYLLAQARQTRWPRLTELEARDQRDAFVTAARATLTATPPPETPSPSSAPPQSAIPSTSPRVARHPQPAIETFLTTLAAINLEPTGQPTNPADIGPGRIGWTGEFSDDMRTATYRWTDPRGTAHTQQYRLLEPEAAVPFFLCTTAISVGEFITLVEAKPEGRDIIAAMPTWINDVSAGTDTDFRPGPQTWRILAPRRTTPTRLNDSRMALNTRWQAFLDPRWPEPYYAPGITAPPPPAADSPMQNLPPEAARLFAEKILGARLPTPEEWAGIEELYAPRLARPDTPGANFSDATWLAQRDYLVRNGALFEHPWPDSGAYTPPGQPLATAQAHATAPAYAPQTTDNALWFADVSSTTTTDGFSHLFGNVATYLYDPLAPAATRYSVAGGSAISPATIDPKKIYPVPSDAEGYADIGLRPAFDASKSMILRGQLMQLLRRQPYVRQNPKSQ